MKYINVKTGAIVNSSSVITGDNWKKTEEKKKEKKKGKSKE